MIINASDEFLQSVHKIKSSNDRKKINAYLNKLIPHIKKSNSIYDFIKMPFSEFYIFQECGEQVNVLFAPDEPYRIDFDIFSLFVAISGNIPKTCHFLLIKMNPL